MTPLALREEISRQWAAVPLRPPVVGDIHPGGPEGLWVSISLTEPDAVPSWIHFRMPGAFVEAAYGNPTAPNALQWASITRSEIPGILREFVSDFEKARTVPVSSC